MSEGSGEKRELTVGTDKNRNVVKKFKKLSESFNKSTLYYKKKYRRYRTEKLVRKTQDSYNSPSGSQEELDGSNRKVQKKESSEEKLQDMCKDARIGLSYFKAIVHNRRLEQFSGSATEILEVVIKILDQLSQSQFSPEISSVLMSCRSRVIQSLAEMVRWADGVMLESDPETRDLQSRLGPAMIDSVQNGVQELVTEALQKIQTQKTDLFALPGRAISLPDVFGTMRTTAHHHRSPSLAFVPRFDFASQNGESDPVNDTPLFSGNSGDKIPPIPPKKKMSVQKPIGIVAPFNHSLEPSSGSLSVFGVKGLTRSEEYLLQYNNIPFHMSSEGGDRTSYCSSFSTDTTDSAELISGDNYEVATLGRYDRYRPSDFQMMRSSRYSDDVGQQLNRICVNVSDVERPSSFPTCQIPISPNLESRTEDETDDYDSSRLSLCSSAYDDSNIPPALPAKLNKHPFGDRSSRDMTNYDKADSDDEEPPPLPTKKSKFEQYMQVFAQNEHLPPPPICDDDIYLEIVERYGTPFSSGSLTRSAVPPNGDIVKPPVQSSNSEFEEKSESFTELPSSVRTRDSGISSSSSGNLVSSLRTSLSSISSLADHSGVGNAPQVPDLPPALPPKTRKPSVRNRSQTMPPVMTSPFRHRSHNDPLSSNWKTVSTSGQGSVFQFPPMQASHKSQSSSQESYQVPHLHPKRTSGGYLRSVLDPLRPDGSSLSCHNRSPCSDHVNNSGPRLIRQVAHVHPHVDSHVSGRNQHVPSLPRKSHSVAESDLRRNSENLTPSTSFPPPPDLNEAGKEPQDKLSPNNKDLDNQPHENPPNQSKSQKPPPPDLPLPDPGNLLDMVDTTDFLTFNRHTDQSAPEVCAGCCDALIVYAAEANKKNYIYYEAFLTTYRTFISTKELLEKLLYRQKLFGADLTTAADRASNRTSRNAFFLLVRVVDELSFVDINKPVLDMLMGLVYELLCEGDLMLAKLLRTKVLAKYDLKRTTSSDTIAQPLASLHITSKVLSIHEFSSEKLAEQMTLLDFELFQKVEIPELIQWAKNQSEELCPNLTRFTEHFNNMSYWTRTIILTQQKPQEREKLLNKFIRTMRHLRKLNNFNSYLAVLSALDSAPVRRLEWQKQTTEGLQEYCSLIDSSSSFRTYRAALAEASRPCIPYLGLILQDLTFVHLGNPDELAPKVVNFRKRWQQFNILDNVRRFKQSQYPFQRDEDVVTFFDKFSKHLAEEALWDLSLDIKPRNRRQRRPPPLEGDQHRVSSTDQSQDDGLNAPASTKESEQTS